jgi:hypothetical protein
VALSGIWMTLAFPISKPEGLPSYDGVTVYVVRLLVGVAMMLRSYALGLGAGTQALTHIPWFIFPSIHGEFARTLFMAAGWAINLAVAEWLIVRKRRRIAQTGGPAHPSGHSPDGVSGRRSGRPNQ